MLLNLSQNLPATLRQPASRAQTSRNGHCGSQGARSISQVCELLLSEGVQAYKKEGPKFMQCLVAKQEARVKDTWPRREHVALHYLYPGSLLYCREARPAQATSGLGSG